MNVGHPVSSHVCRSLYWVYSYSAHLTPCALSPCLVSVSAPAPLIFNLNKTFCLSCYISSYIQSDQSGSFRNLRFHQTNI